MNFGCNLKIFYDKEVFYLKLGKINLCCMVSVGLFLGTYSAEAVLDPIHKSNLDTNTEIFKKVVERYLPELNSEVLSHNVLDFFQFVYNRYLFVSTMFMDSRYVNDKELIYYISHSLNTMEEYLCARKVQKDSAAYQLVHFTFGGLSQLCASILEKSKGNFCIADAMSNTASYYFRKFFDIKFPDSYANLKSDMDELLERNFISGLQYRKIFSVNLKKLLNSPNSDSESGEQVMHSSPCTSSGVNPLKKSKLSETDHGSVGVGIKEISSSAKPDLSAQTGCCISSEEALVKEMPVTACPDMFSAESQDTSVNANPLKITCTDFNCVTDPVADTFSQEELAACNHGDEAAVNNGDPLDSEQEETPILSFEREVFENLYENTDALWDLSEFPSIDFLKKEYEFFEFVPSELPQSATDHSSDKDT